MTPELPPGESSIRQMERNARGDFANVSVIASEVDKLVSYTQGTTIDDDAVAAAIAEPLEPAAHTP